MTPGNMKPTSPEALTVTLDASAGMTLGAALVAGLAGSAHCFAMCGGLTGALAMRPAASSPRFILLQQAGRIAGYSTTGATVGWLGSTLPTESLPVLAKVLRVASGGLIVLMALRILYGWNVLRPIERAGASVWMRIRPAMRYAASHRNSTLSSLFTGLLWGWMPCGLVYSMLMLAAFGGRAGQGAGVMLAFGLGTLPSMLASSFLFAKLPQGLSGWSPRYATGALLMAFGIWSCASALTASHAGHAYPAVAEVTHEHSHDDPTM